MSSIGTVASISATSQGLSRQNSNSPVGGPTPRGGYGNGKPRPNAGASNPGGNASRFPALRGK